ERAVVGRIDVHRGVVAPTRVRVGLNAGSVNDRALTEGHLARGIAGEPAGVANARVHVRGIHDAVAERHVALPVLGDRAHPAVDTISWSVGPLLEQGVC